MIARRNGRRLERVLIDLNTQRDFLDPCGLHPVRNRGEVIPAIRQVMAWAKWHGVPVISSVQSIRPSEAVPGNPQACCVDGSLGQQKLSFTLCRSRAEIEYDNTLGLALDVVREFQQLIFRKRTEDLLANPKADRLLTQLSAEEFMIIGNTLETAVKALALGMITRGKRIAIVVDACGYWDAGAADLALRQVSAKGARLTTAQEVLGAAHLRWRYPNAVAILPGHNGQNGHKDRNGKNGTNGQRAQPVILARPAVGPVRRKRKDPGQASGPARM